VVVVVVVDVLVDVVLVLMASDVCVVWIIVDDSA
jgi:hypothetical protein